MSTEPNRIAGAAGLGAVFLNLLGVAFATEVDHIYRPGTIDRWYFSAIENAGAQAWSAWCFATGMLLLVAFLAGLARAMGPYSWPAAALGSVAAIINACCSLLPFVVVTHLPHNEDAIGQTLLGIALTGDAFFNGAFGISLLFLALAMARAVEFPMWLSGMGLLSGLATTVVVTQAWSPLGADFLAVAGPMWLAWVMLTSVALLRLRYERVASATPIVVSPNRLPLNVPERPELLRAQKSASR